VFLMSEDLLVVELARQQYALRVQQVREVVPRAALTVLPGAPPGVLGILQLRGALLPVIDLRQRLNVPATPAQISQSIVVALTRGFAVGLLVDAVGGIAAADVGVVSERQGSSGALITSVAEVHGQLMTILDPDAAVGAELAAFLSEILTASAAVTDAGARRPQQEAVES
jgi:purine-binding chemotaxis protein CheW